MFDGIFIVAHMVGHDLGEDAKLSLPETGLAIIPGYVVNSSLYIIAHLRPVEGSLHAN